MQTKRLAALAILASAHPHGVSRDVLAAMLWPEASSKRARRRVSATLYELRNAIGPLIADSGHELRYRPEVLSCDVVDFEEALTADDPLAAMEVYGGPFLDGVHIAGTIEYEHWASGQRDRYARHFAAAIETVAEKREDAGDPIGAVDAWRRLAAHDPYNARIAARTMTALAQAGDRAGAIAHGERYVERFREVLEIEPDPMVFDLIEAIRQEPSIGGLPVPDLTVRSDPHPPVAAPTRPRDPPASAPKPVHRRRQRSRTARLSLAAALLALGVIGGAYAMISRPLLTADTGVADGTRLPAPYVAVLPFQNLGPPGHAYFAAGITEELTVRLAAIPGLAVIGRMSAAHYTGREQDGREAGIELRADYVLEGSVRWASNRGEGGQVRITPRLVRVEDGANLWVDTFDRDVVELLAVQEEIAEEVARALGLVLVRGSEPVGRRATIDLHAYDYYLRGTEYAAQAGETATRTAVRFFEQAVELDPEFTPARQRLVRSRVGLAWTWDDREQGRLAMQELERLEEMDPHGIDTRMARAAFLFRGSRDYADALREFETIRALHPGDVRVIHEIGHLHQRLGHIDEAIAMLNTALHLEPRSRGIAYRLGQTFHAIGQYDEAEEFYERAVAMAPDGDFPRSYLARIHVARGDTARAWATLDRAPEYGADLFIGPRLHLLRRDYEAAVERMLDVPAILPISQLHRYDALADGYGRAGDPVRMGAYADSLLELAAEMAPERPEWDTPRSQFTNLTWAFQGLALIHHGEFEAGLRKVRRTIDAEERIEGLAVGTVVRELAARAFVRAGEYESALAVLAELLSGPALLSRNELRLDPEWDPLRTNPRFKELLSTES